ncbi:MAG: hypothetical protein MHM6MM_003509 [Cercozoa sp. M6MM]
MNFTAATVVALIRTQRAPFVLGLSVSFAIALMAWAISSVVSKGVPTQEALEKETRFVSMCEWDKFATGVLLLALGTVVHDVLTKESNFWIMFPVSMCLYLGATSFLFASFVSTDSVLSTNEAQRDAKRRSKKRRKSKRRRRSKDSPFIIANPRDSLNIDVDVEDDSFRELSTPLVGRASRSLKPTLTASGEAEKI